VRAVNERTTSLHPFFEIKVDKIAAAPTYTHGYTTDRDHNELGQDDANRDSASKVVHEMRQKSFPLPLPLTSPQFYFYRNAEK